MEVSTCTADITAPIAVAVFGWMIGSSGCTIKYFSVWPSTIMATRKPSNNKAVKYAAVVRRRMGWRMGRGGGAGCGGKKNFYKKST